MAVKEPDLLESNLSIEERRSGHVVTRLFFSAVSLIVFEFYPGPPDTFVRFDCLVREEEWDMVDGASGFLSLAGGGEDCFGCYSTLMSGMAAGP